MATPRMIIRYGLEVWQAVIGDEVLAEFMSQWAAERRCSQYNIRYN